MRTNQHSLVAAKFNRLVGHAWPDSCDEGRKNIAGIIVNIEWYLVPSGPDRDISANYRVGNHEIPQSIRVTNPYLNVNK